MIHPIRDMALLKDLPGQGNSLGLTIVELKRKVDRDGPISMEVVAVGPKCRDVEVGMRVLVQPYDGRWVDPWLPGDETRHIMIEESNIMAIQEAQS